jgi:hypothetical protein
LIEVEGEELRFASDSAVEEAGFEPSVPLAMDPLSRTANAIKIDA